MSENEAVQEEELVNEYADAEVPPLVDPDIELEDGDSFNQSPEFQEAVRRAQLGQFEHTLFEMWDIFLDRALGQTTQTITIPVVDGILRQWPYLKITDVPEYLSMRAAYLSKIQQILRENYPKPQELLFQENVDDWKLHKDAYVDVVVAWNQQTARWNRAWEEMPFKTHAKVVRLAVLSDIAALVVNEENGMVENIRNLADFDLTEEDVKAIVLRIKEVNDE